MVPCVCEFEFTFFFVTDGKRSNHTRIICILQNKKATQDYTYVVQKGESEGEREERRDEQEREIERGSLSPLTFY